MAATKDTVVKDSWDKKVEIKIPKAANGEPNYMIASVNGRTFKLQRGIKVEVPEPIAEVIEHSFEAEEAADLYIEGKTN